MCLWARPLVGLSTVLLGSMWAGTVSAAIFSVSACVDSIQPITTDVYFGWSYENGNRLCLSSTGDTITGETVAGAGAWQDSGDFYWEDYNGIDIWAEKSATTSYYELQISWSLQFQVNGRLPGESINASALINGDWMNLVPGVVSGTSTLSGTGLFCDPNDDLHPCGPIGLGVFDWGYQVVSDPSSVGAVPLPGAAVLLASGFFGLAAGTRRRVKSTVQRDELQ